MQEAIYLNRLVRLYPPGAEGGERWEIEADPRHVEILVSQMGLNNESKAVSTPGVRMTDEDDGKGLDAENRACHRPRTMRASYLSQDRCELQFAVRELARRMQQPNTKNMQALKRLVRFLKGSPKCLVGETTSGRDSVEGDCLKAWGRTSKTSPYQSLVGARGGGTTRAGHRECSGN